MFPWAHIDVFFMYLLDFKWQFPTPFCSSLHTALSLAYLGAPEGTPTSKELIELLGLDPQHTEDYLYNYLRVLNTQNELSEKLNTNLQLANKVKRSFKFYLRE